MIARLFATLAMKVAAGLQLVSLGFILFLLLAKAGETRRADLWQARAGEEASAHQRTIAEVRRVRAEQKEMDLQHARHVERAQSRISEEASYDYQQALADLRRRYDALRLSAGKGAADPGGGGGTDLPRIPDAAGRPDGAAGKDGFPAEDLFLCSVQSHRLDALQHWLREQQKVER